MKTLDMYSKMHERFEKDGTMAGSEGNRRQVSRRESVKMSANSILDDMGDAFEDLADVDLDMDEDDAAEEDDDEGDDEIWDPHTTESGETYYVGRKSRRLKLDYPICRRHESCNWGGRHWCWCRNQE